MNEYVYDVPDTLGARNTELNQSWILCSSGGTGRREGDKNKSTIKKHTARSDKIKIKQSCVHILMFTLNYFRLIERED